MLIKPLNEGFSLEMKIRKFLFQEKNLEDNYQASGELQDSLRM